MKKIYALVLCLSVTTIMAKDIDERKILSLNGMQRNHMLTGMHAMLHGTQQILQALSEEDMMAVARHARMLGMERTHKGENHLHSILPKDFMQLGMSMHRSFDQIATDAETLKDPKHTLAQLSATMQYCSACHAAYQIQTIKQPVETEAHSDHDKHQGN
jgi:cytochrome c553